jgi:hypothetical protein
MIKTLIFLLTFAIIASPAYFKFLHSILGGWAASSEGIARPAGLLVAGIVFMLILAAESRVSGYRKKKVTREKRRPDTLPGREYGVYDVYHA